MSTSIHDALFKGTFSQVEHAAGELRAVLPPALTARLDFSTLTLRPGSFVDEALASRHTDLLFSVLFAGRPAFLYTLFEHRSTPDRFMPLRLLGYMVRIWDAYRAENPDAKKLPVILPVVLFHGDGGGWEARAFEDLLDIDADLLAEIAPHVPRFRFVLDDLDALSDEAIRARAMSALGRLVLWCLKHAREQGRFVRELGRWADLVREARNGPEGADAIQRIFRYIFHVDDELTVDALRELVAKTVGEGIQEEIVTLAERLQEEGKQKGRVEGRLEGEQKGRRELLIKQLTLRFGRLSEVALARVNGADAAQLDIWAERVITAATLKDVIDLG